jgi:hypothetical protein
VRTRYLYRGSKIIYFLTKYWLLILIIGVMAWGFWYAEKVEGELEDPMNEPSIQYPQQQPQYQENQR